MTSKIDEKCGYTANFSCVGGCDLNSGPFKLSDFGTGSLGRTLIVETTEIALNSTKIDINLELYWAQGPATRLLSFEIVFHADPAPVSEPKLNCVPGLVT